MSGKPKVLFYSLHSGIWLHAFPEGLVAESLRKQGFDVHYVGCDRVLSSYCVVMSASGLSALSSDEAKRKTCESCNRNKRMLRSQLNLQGSDLGEWLSEKELAEIDSILARVTASNYLELAIDGVHVGRLASYEVLLHHKKSNMDFDAGEWKEYLAALRSALRSLYAGRNLLDSVKPEIVVMYNTLYSANSVLFWLAKHRGIKAYFLHAGANLAHRLETLVIGTDIPFEFLKDLQEYWGNQSRIPCSARELDLVTDHFSELFKGSNIFAYSSPKSGGAFSARTHFGVSAVQKLLVATLSSNDERFAAETMGFLPKDYDLLFPTQIEWVEALIAEARRRPGWFLVIRVHPRDFPNKRDAVKSEHAMKLESLLTDLPDNVKANWPDDRISIYDLAEESDVFLNSASSAGKEVSLLGIPAVLYSRDLVLYPPDLNYVGTTLSEYFACIEKALVEGWGFDRIRRTYRWYALEYARSLIDLSDAWNPGIMKPRAWRNKLPAVSHWLDCKRRPGKLKAGQVLGELFSGRLPMVLDAPSVRTRAVADESMAFERETAELRRQIGRLTQMMYSGATGQAKAGSLRARLEAAK